jgi:hypothetical protein
VPGGSRHDGGQQEVLKFSAFLVHTVETTADTSGMTQTRRIAAAALTLAAFAVIFAIGFLAPGGTEGVANTIGQFSQTGTAVDMDAPVGTPVEVQRGYGMTQLAELPAMDADPAPGEIGSCLIMPIAELTDPAYILLVNAGWTGIQDGRALLSPDC